MSLGNRLTHSTPADVDRTGMTITVTPPITPKKNGKMLTVNVVMLDDTVADFHVQAKSAGRLLFNLVCRHLNLLEADYFGLEYEDAAIKYWLDLDKPIQRQIGLRLNSPCVRFCVKFYTPDPSHLEEEYTRYLFCLQIKRDLMLGDFQCNDNTAALIISYIVQAECGDYSPEDYPDYTYLSSPRLVPFQDKNLEEKIMENHKKLLGQTPAEADINLLETARRCEMYGVKMHPAKDQEGVILNLAVTHMGIVVFQSTTKINTFSWAKIRKISFKRKRFLIKLLPEGHGYYKEIVEFIFDNRNQCKGFWKKCVENHGFFRCSSVDRIPRQKARVLSRGSSFRYSGKTQKEVIDYVRENYVKRQTFPRHQSFRMQRSLAPSLIGVTTSSNMSMDPSSSSLAKDIDGLSISLSGGSMSLSCNQSPTPHLAETKHRPLMIQATCFQESSLVEHHHTSSVAVALGSSLSEHSVDHQHRSLYDCNPDAPSSERGLTRHHIQQVDPTHGRSNVTYEIFRENDSVDKVAPPSHELVGPYFSKSIRNVSGCKASEKDYGYKESQKRTYIGNESSNSAHTAYIAPLNCNQNVNYVSYPYSSCGEEQIITNVSSVLEKEVDAEHRIYSSSYPGTIVLPKSKYHHYDEEKSSVKNNSTEKFGMTNSPDDLSNDSYEVFDERSGSPWKTGSFLSYEAVNDRIESEFVPWQDRSADVETRLGYFAPRYRNIGFKEFNEICKKGLVHNLSGSRSQNDIKCYEPYIFGRRTVSSTLACDSLLRTASNPILNNKYAKKTDKLITAKCDNLAYDKKDEDRNSFLDSKRIKPFDIGSNEVHFRPDDNLNIGNNNDVDVDSNNLLLMKNYEKLVTNKKSSQLMGSFSDDDNNKSKKLMFDRTSGNFEFCTKTNVDTSCRNNSFTKSSTNSPEGSIRKLPHSCDQLESLINKKEIIIIDSEDMSYAEKSRSADGILIVEYRGNKQKFNKMLSPNIGLNMGTNSSRSNTDSKEDIVSNSSFFEDIPTIKISEHLSLSSLTNPHEKKSDIQNVSNVEGASKKRINSNSNKIICNSSDLNSYPTNIKLSYTPSKNNKFQIRTHVGSCKADKLSCKYFVDSSKFPSVNIWDEKERFILVHGLSEGSATIRRPSYTSTSVRKAKSLDTPVVSRHKLPPITSFSYKDDTVDAEDSSIPGNVYVSNVQQEEYTVGAPVKETKEASSENGAKVAEKINKEKLASLIRKQSLDTSSVNQPIVIDANKERSKSEGSEGIQLFIEKKMSTRQERLDSFKKLRNFSIELTEQDSVDVDKCADRSGQENCDEVFSDGPFDCVTNPSPTSHPPIVGSSGENLVENRAAQYCPTRVDNDDRDRTSKNMNETVARRKDDEPQEQKKSTEPVNSLDESSTSSSFLVEPIKHQLLESSATSSIENEIMDDADMSLAIRSLNNIASNFGGIDENAIIASKIVDLPAVSTSFFPLTQTLSCISELSTNSELEKTEIDDHSINLQRSKSVSIDDTYVSLDQHPSLSSDPPSGLNLENVFDEDDDNGELSPDGVEVEDRKTTFTTAVSCFKEGETPVLASSAAAASMEGPSIGPPSSIPSLNEPVFAEHRLRRSFDEENSSVLDDNCEILGGGKVGAELTSSTTALEDQSLVMNTSPDVSSCTTTTTTMKLAVDEQQQQPPPQQLIENLSRDTNPANTDRNVAFIAGSASPQTSNLAFLAGSASPQTSLERRVCAEEYKEACVPKEFNVTRTDTGGHERHCHLWPSKIFQHLDTDPYDSPYTTDDVDDSANNNANLLPFLLPNPPAAPHLKLSTSTVCAQRKYETQQFAKVRKKNAASLQKKNERSRRPSLRCTPRIRCPPSTGGSGCKSRSALRLVPHYTSSSMSTSLESPTRKERMLSKMVARNKCYSHFSLARSPHSDDGSTSSDDLHSARLTSPNTIPRVSKRRRRCVQSTGAKRFTLKQRLHFTNA